MITLTKGAIPAVSVSHTTCRIAQLHGLQRQRTPHLAPAPRMLCVPGLTRAGMERPALRRLDSRTSIVIPTGSCRFTRWHRPFGTGYSVSVWRPCARCRSSADYLDLLGLVAWPLAFRRLTEDTFGALLSGYSAQPNAGGRQRAHPPEWRHALVSGRPLAGALFRSPPHPSGSRCHCCHSLRRRRARLGRLHRARPGGLCIPVRLSNR